MTTLITVKIYISNFFFLPLSKNINEKTAKNIALFLNSVIYQKPKQINDKNEMKNFDGLFLW